MPDRTAPASEPRKRLFSRLKSAGELRAAVRRAAAAIAAVAAVGAVLGGLTGFWSTYKLVVGEWFGRQPPVSARSRVELPPAASSPPRLSIAVLPFDNLSGDAAQDYFSDGIVENLTTDLSVNIPNLLVIASASTLSYKGKRVDAREAGHELNVRYLLRGSVLRTGRDVRINARLIDAESGRQLWADRLDGDTSNVIALQDQVTARISTLLRVALVTAGARQAQTNTNPDSFDLSLRAQAALNDERRLGINPRRQTESYYRKALAVDPDNVDAGIGLASVLAENLMNSPSLPPADRPGNDQVGATRAEILELLRKASLRGDSAEIHMARAHLFNFDRKLEDASKELERALALNPNETAAMFRMAGNYTLQGAPEKALPLFREFYARTAGKTASWRAAARVWGIAYLFMGRWNEAADKLQEALALGDDPNFGTSGRLAVALLGAGKTQAATEQYESFRRWYTDRYDTAPTLKAVREDTARFSQNPAYLKLYEATVIDGFRKLGMRED
jgi:TolB-like protein